MMRIFDTQNSASAAGTDRQDVFICMKLAAIDTEDKYNTLDYISFAFDQFNHTGEPRRIFTNQEEAIQHLNRYTSSVHCVYQVTVPKTAIIQTSPSTITLNYRIQPADFMHLFFHPTFTPLPGHSSMPSA